MFFSQRDHSGSMIDIGRVMTALRHKRPVTNLRLGEIQPLRQLQRYARDQIKGTSYGGAQSIAPD
jgi:hypothetical protein